MNKAKIIISELDKHYGVKHWKRWREPVGELVRTILSQNTTDKNSLRAYANLIETFKTWDEILEADETEIAEPIRSGGLANIKAKKIKKSLLEIKKREGKIDLEFLADYNQDEAEDYLVSLDGVGPKTAACVLIFSFNFPIMPVDTHVHRLSNRIGLVATKTREKTQEAMKTIIPKKNIYSFHLNLIEHGRKVCKASKPLCSQCFLTDFCDYFQENLNKIS
ncbi:MAG: endonuclease III [Candidatus Heimdallarchaeota archaeon]|nr:endonuclease III [Candidatus Heimdallarchaeota archaeon]MCK4290413.1 endonuclease III [Candidatus Heimdallarchaeota archaeon]